jgi:hypothetical protein
LFGLSSRLKDHAQKKFFEQLINAQASGAFEFKHNKLRRKNSKGGPDTHSDYLGQKLDAAIASSDVVTLERADSYQSSDGVVHNLADVGEGLTDTTKYSPHVGRHIWKVQQFEGQGWRPVAQ